MHGMSILLHVTRLLVTHASSLVKACSITVPVPRWLRFHLQTSAPLVFFFDGAMTSFRNHGECSENTFVRADLCSLSLDYPLISREHIQKKSFTKIHCQNLCEEIQGSVNEN